MTKTAKTEAPMGIDAEPEAEVVHETVAAKVDGLAKQRAAALEALKANCGNCHCSHFPIEDLESWGECRHEPPRMQIIAMPPRVAAPGQGPVYQPLSAWPPIQRVQWCVTGFMPKAKVTQ